MDKITFKLKGAKEMEALLRDMGPKVASRLGDRALRAGVKPIVKEAKRLVPVKSGELKRSIVARSGNRNRRQDQRIIMIGFKQPAARRAHFTEFGTSRASARPFIRPAMDSRAQDALTEMAERLAQGIESEEWKRATELGGEIITIE